MSDSDNSMEEFRPYLEPFLRAAERYEADDPDWFTAIENYVTAEPITDDDDELSRAWTMISIAAVLLGAVVRHESGPGEDGFWYMQPRTLDGTSISLDDAAPPEQATAIRLMMTGANNDFDTTSALVSATWNQAGPPGMMHLLAQLVSLYVTMQPTAQAVE